MGGKVHLSDCHEWYKSWWENQRREEGCGSETWQKLYKPVLSSSGRTEGPKMPVRLGKWNLKGREVDVNNVCKTESLKIKYA